MKPPGTTRPTAPQAEIPFGRRRILANRLFKSALILTAAIAAVSILPLSMIVVQNITNLKAPIPTEITIHVDEVPDSISIDALWEAAPAFLRSQILMGTVPELYLVNLIRFKDKATNNFLRWNRMHLLDRFYTETGNQPYGAFVLFGNNFGGIYDSVQFKSYISLIKRKYTLHLRFRAKAGGAEKLVLIEPIIGADCVPNNVPVVYCRCARGLDSVLAVGNNEYADAADAASEFRKIGEQYRAMGMHTPLSPNVDLTTNGYIIGIADLETYGLLASNHLHAHGVIPVLKHFGYDQRRDAHLGSYVESINLDSLMRVLSPYAALERTGYPYFAMTTHFRLGAVDSHHVQTQSQKVADFIHSRFPNAVIMTDALNMLGYSGSGAGRFALLRARLNTMMGREDMRAKILAARGDLFMVHSANWWPERDRLKLYQGMKERDSAETARSVRRILALKRHYGLIKVYDRSDRDGIPE